MRRGSNHFSYRVGQSRCWCHVENGKRVLAFYQAPSRQDNGDEVDTRVLKKRQGS